MHLMMFIPTGAFGMDCFAVDIDFSLPSQVSISFITILDIGYLKKKGLGQIGWMGICKNAISAL